MLRIGLVSALAGSAACGRVGFDPHSDDGAAAQDASASDSASAASGDGGFAPNCPGEPGPDCVGLTLGGGIGSSQNVGGELMHYPVSIDPTCEPGEVVEQRVQIIAPASPALLEIEVTAAFDTVVTVLQTDCSGAVDSCTSIPQGSDTLVEVVMSPGERYLISVGSSTNCGNVDVALRSSALGSS